MNYEDMSKDELIELLKEKEGLIGELRQEEIDLSDEVNSLESYISEMEVNEDKEVTAEKAFYAGFNSDDESVIKAWLNYKIGERL